MNLSRFFPDTAVISMVVVMVVLVFASCVKKQPATNPLEDGKVVDLTHDFDEETVYWPTAKEFQLETVVEDVMDPGYFMNLNNYSASEHGGTHLDAPYHFNQDGIKLHEIPIDRFVGPAVVIDVSSNALENRDYQIDTTDIKSWEEDNGRIPEGAIVLLKTGYGQYWPDRKRYMGTDARGSDAVDSLHFPGLHPDAAQWIAENRDIRLIGIDTPSIDYGQSKTFSTHVNLLKAGIPAMENIANLDKLPAKDFHVIALPMKIKNGSGGPLRIIAITDAS